MLQCYPCLSLSELPVPTPGGLAYHITPLWGGGVYTQIVSTLELRQTMISCFSGVLFLGRIDLDGWIFSRKNEQQQCSEGLTSGPSGQAGAQSGGRPTCTDREPCCWCLVDGLDDGFGHSVKWVWSAQV